MDITIRRQNGQDVYVLQPNGAQIGYGGAVIDMDGTLLDGDPSVLSSGVVNILHYAEAIFWEPESAIL